jgi:hypothetical protein
MVWVEGTGDGDAIGESCPALEGDPANYPNINRVRKWGDKKSKQLV